MLLVVDIGNTNIVLGVFQANTLSHSWRIATQRERTADEYAVLCQNLFARENLASDGFDAVVISSVVPPLNESFLELSRRYFSKEPVFVEPDRQHLIPILYRPPSDVGADRIVNALGALQLEEPPLIVVDFGTATTFDAISAKGEYIGGVISPGVGISAEALFSRASKLPRIEVKRPGRVIGDSTVCSMQAGLYFGYVSLVEGIIGRMQRELPDSRVLATGGFARTIAPDLPCIRRVEPDLTLFGLHLFYNKSK